MKWFSSLFVFFLSILSIDAQVILENNPPSVSWYEMTTPHFRVLFPEGFEAQANRTASALEVLYPAEIKTLTSAPPRFSVLLQNRSSLSNAFVSVNPRRAELFTMPSQDYNFIGNNDWLDYISSHEFRHIVQYEHARQGFNKFVYYTTGNFGLSAMANAAVPAWFWEGDAVVTETAYTPTGRGEIPNFNLLFRTNFLENRTFNYHKQYLGSYKHAIPNEYVLGYHMVGYLRKKTGDPLIWDRITSRAWRNSIIPFTFSNAIKKETGLSVTQLYREMSSELSHAWRDATDSVVLTAYARINNRKKTAYTDYQYPQLLNDSLLIVMKSGIGDIEKLVKLSGTREEKIFVPGIINNTGMMSAAGSKIVWNEYRFDPRWRVQTYSVIVLYDTRTGKKKMISPFRSRYAGAALSPDATSIVTVESDRQYRHRVVILDVNGKKIHEFNNPNNNFYSMARFSSDGKSIVALKTTDKGKAVVIFQGGAERELVPPSDENIGYPVLHGEYLLFNSPISGIDNIYALHLQTKQRFQLTNSRYGAYNPLVTPDGQALYYNDQSRNGMEVARIPFDPTKWISVNDDSQSEDLLLARTIIEQEGNQDLLDGPLQGDFPVKKYSKVKGMLNPYTWGPYVDNTLAQVDVGIASQDVISTTAISVGYRYDVFEETGEIHGGISFQGWYPILNADVYYGNRKDDHVLGVSSNDIRDVQFEWQETGFSLGASVPLLLTRSKYLTTLSFSNDVGWTQTADFSSVLSRNGEVIFEGSDRYVPANDTLYYLYSDITDFGNLLYNHASIDFSHTLKQSHRDFNPRWGQFISLESFTTPYGGDYQGALWAARGVLYFPGLFKHQSLFFRGGYQQSPDDFELDTYAFRNQIFKPRGYSYPRNSTFYTLSGNYALPVWYPDVALGPLLYIQRVKANFFYDYGQGEGMDYFYNFDSGRVYQIDRSDTYHSMGAEVTFDLNLFRLLPQFELGIRATYITENTYSDSGWVYEFLIANIPL